METAEAAAAQARQLHLETARQQGILEQPDSQEPEAHTSDVPSLQAGAGAQEVTELSLNSQEPEAKVRPDTQRSPMGLGYGSSATIGPATCGVRGIFGCGRGCRKRMLKLARPGRHLMLWKRWSRPAGAQDKELLSGAVQPQGVLLVRGLAV